MYELKKKLKRHLRIHLLGPGPRLIKKNLLGCGLTKVEKHCSKAQYLYLKISVTVKILKAFTKCSSAILSGVDW